MSSSLRGQLASVLTRRRALLHNLGRTGPTTCSHAASACSVPARYVPPRRTLSSDAAAPSVTAAPTSVPPQTAITAADAPLAPTTADQTASGSNPALDTPPIKIESLLDQLPDVLQTRDPRRIFSFYVNLHRVAAGKLPNNTYVALWDALGPRDMVSCVDIFRDYLLYDRAAPQSAANGVSTSFATMTTRFLDAACKTEEHLDLADTLVFLGEVLHDRRASWDMWAVLLDRATAQYVHDEAGERWRTMGRTALTLMDQCRAAARENRFAVDEETLTLLTIRALGLMGDLDALNAHAGYHDLPEGFLISSAMATQWIAAFARAGDFERGRQLFVAAVQRRETPALEAAYTLMATCAYEGKVATCMDLHSAFLDVYGTTVHDGTFDLYSPLIEACRIALVKDRFKRHPTHDEYTHRISVIKVFFDARHRMRELAIPIREQSHESILTCLVFANYDDHLRYPMTLAAQALEEMLADGYIPTEYAFHTLMRGYANNKESIHSLDRAALITRYMDVMRACQVPVTATACSILILSLMPRKTLKNRRPFVIQRIKEVERDMLRWGVRHNRASLHALMRTYGAHREYSEVYRVLDAMPKHDVQRDAASYFTVFHACHDAPASAHYALQVLYPQMLRDGVAADANLYHTLLACCVTVNNDALAWQLYEDMVHRAGIEPTHSVLNYMLKMALYNKHVARAQFILDEFSLRRMYYDPTSFYHLMTYFTRIEPDEKRVQALFERMREQSKLFAQYTELSASMTATPAASATADSADADALNVVADPPSLRRIPASDEPNQPMLIVLPPIPRLPPLGVPEAQQPIEILVDTRLNLKALQAYIMDKQYGQAFSTYCNLLCDFHVALLHKFAMSKQYRTEVALAAAHDQLTVGHSPTLTYKVLTYPPRIVNYNPYNNATGSLYLPRDVATATWIMCNALLDLPESHVPQSMPPLRYVYLHRGLDPHPVPADQVAEQYLSMIRYRTLPVAGRHRLAVARVLFRSAIRVLRSYLGFNTILRFAWVRDLMARLHYSTVLSVHAQQLVRTDMSAPRAPTTAANAVKPTAMTQWGGLPALQGNPLANAALKWSVRAPPPSTDGGKPLTRAAKAYAKAVLKQPIASRDLPGSKWSTEAVRDAFALDRMSVERLMALTASLGTAGGGANADPARAPAAVYPYSSGTVPPLQGIMQGQSALRELAETPWSREDIKDPTRPTGEWLTTRTRSNELSEAGKLASLLAPPPVPAETTPGVADAAVEDERALEAEMAYDDDGLTELELGNLSGASISYLAKHPYPKDASKGVRRQYKDVQRDKLRAKNKKKREAEMEAGAVGEDRSSADARSPAPPAVDWQVPSASPASAPESSSSSRAEEPRHSDATERE
ncbi:pentatricopeptide repeat domain-containing protein [Allomyces macrogynus ATCC 38327]|uniref:Pentatricopeptide repeat domain-containing protein n=1 Tax=Allomyces macrogynus (strain ATCC 38327) TaxID=578462 RepID=A0A0L0SZ88_ALLM3|nr:pentatricopeptide repeat domain-containing protein [Allomyces macrogynus ATCC 38327]|eukprot:KNE67629.1 pentatricopeptide repeat domain-containing protein [Allomyces macrogynus ATCC 38327]